jgi:acid phosphatase class B
MITFYDDQAPLDTNSTTSIVVTFNKSKENTSQLNKEEYINDEEIRSSQADVNNTIQRVKENYFLEHRSLL